MSVTVTVPRLVSNTSLYASPGVHREEAHFIVAQVPVKAGYRMFPPHATSVGIDVVPELPRSRNLNEVHRVAVHQVVDMNIVT